MECEVYIMPFCGNCGTELKNNEAFCPNCGAPTGNAPQYQAQNAAGMNPPDLNEIKDKVGDVFGKIDDKFDTATDKVENFVNNQIVSPPDVVPDADDAEVLWMNVLAFFIPIVGIILWFINRGNKPVMSRGILKWTLIGLVFSLVRYFLFG